MRRKGLCFGKKAKESKGPVHETCRECGKVWNVSVLATFPDDGYQCPVCWMKARKNFEKK